MGWTFDYCDVGREQHIHNMTQPSCFPTGYTHLEHRVVGNHIWHLLRIEETGRVMIGLTLIAKEKGGGWGEKGMSEDAGPCYYDCPLALLNKATPAPAGGYAEGWREKVRAYHAKRAAKPTPRVGLVVKSDDTDYRLVTSAGPRRGWVVQRVSDGVGFRMPAAQLSRALQSTV